MKLPGHGTSQPPGTNALVSTDVSMENANLLIDRHDVGNEAGADLITSGTTPAATRTVCARAIAAHGYAAEGG
jgi:hypothetical protein